MNEQVISMIHSLLLKGDKEGYIKAMDEHCGCDLDLDGGYYCYIRHPNDDCLALYGELMKYLGLADPEPEDCGERCYPRCERDAEAFHTCRLVCCESGCCYPDENF